MHYRIENMTVSAQLEQPFEPSSLSKIPGVHLAENGSSLTINLDGSTSIQVYRSGKIICTGCRDKTESIRTINDSIEKMELKTEIKDVRICDIMVSTRTDHELNLEKLYVEFGHYSEYIPEWFGGLILHLDDGKSTAVLYKSGKIVLSGVTDLDHAYDILKDIASKV